MFVLKLTVPRNFAEVICKPNNLLNSDVEIFSHTDEHACGHYLQQTPII
jgi:hypothetical protein